MTEDEIRKWLASGDLAQTLRDVLEATEGQPTDVTLRAVMTGAVILAERCNRLQSAVCLLAAAGDLEIAGRVARILDEGETG